MKIKQFFLILIVTLMFCQSQANGVQLKIETLGRYDVQDYVCINSLGCFNLHNSHGKELNVGPINFKYLQSMAIVNFSTNLVSHTKVNPFCQKIKSSDDHQLIVIKLQVSQVNDNQASVINKIDCVMANGKNGR